MTFLRSRPTTALLVATIMAVTSALGAATAASPSPSDGSSSSEPSAGWTYLALGDSNVYGPPDVCGDCRTYPHLLKERIEGDLGIPVTLIDGSQWNRLTSLRLLEEIEQDSWGESWELPHDPARSPREAIAAADLITITVAANDLPWAKDTDPCAGTYDQACIERVVEPYRANLEGILGAIATIRAGEPTAIRVTTIYNDLLPGPAYDPTWFYTPEFLAASTAGATVLLDALNAAIRDTALANGAAVVDMRSVANGPDGSQGMPAGWFSEAYGDLNQAAHDAFAATIMEQGFVPLSAPGG